MYNLIIIYYRDIYATINTINSQIGPKLVFKKKNVKCGIWEIGILKENIYKKHQKSLKKDCSVKMFFKKQFPWENAKIGENLSKVVKNCFLKKIFLGAKV